jgi:very-short-patch-repair endonuclease
VSASTISRWVSEGYLHLVLPRVYAVGHTAAGPEAALAEALLYGGPGAMLSHATGLWWWGLSERQPRQIQISTPKNCPSPNGTVRVYGRRQLDRHWHRRFPVTSVAQTLLDFATEAAPRQLRRALAEADYRRLLDVSAMNALCGQGRKGSDALRKALAEHQPDLARTRSELEERFLELCKKGRLPSPELNVTVCGLMVDALWREQRVIVELDGRGAHGTPAQIARDHERDLKLRAAGFVVLRYTWSQITRNPAAVLADLKQALGVR